ncbi:MAG: HAD family hydrolase [Myxococcota bacterium]
MTNILWDGQPFSPDVLFLDCDGVIFDSNPMKSGVFAEALRPFGTAAVDRMLSYHRAHGGISRYAKLDWFFREVVAVEDVEEAMRAALHRFSELSRAGYRALAPRLEALALLGAHPGPKYVVSGSDERELNSVFAETSCAGRPLREWVDAVYGSPTPKVEHIGRCIRQHGADSSRCLLIGDGSGDLRAAEAHGMRFVFIEEMSDWADGRAVTAGRPRCRVRTGWADVFGPSQ